MTQGMGPGRTPGMAWHGMAWHGMAQRTAASCCLCSLPSAAGSCELRNQANVNEGNSIILLQYGPSVDSIGGATCAGLLMLLHPWQEAQQAPTCRPGPWWTQSGPKAEQAMHMRFFIA